MGTDPKLKSKATEIKNLIITGAGGFLGSHLTEHFLKKGVQVLGLDNFSTGHRANVQFLQNLPEAKDNLFFQEVDVVEPWEIWTSKIPKSFLDDVSHILHFASPASPPHYQRLGLETMRVNSAGLERAIQCADTLSAKVLFASTSEIYGDPNVSPQPESYWGNVNSFGERSCYDEAKRYGESWIYTSNRKNGTGHGLIRIFNTYGPRMNPNDGRVVINFLLQAYKNQPITMYGDGSQTRSFCFVSDLVDGIESYLKSGIVEPVNLGNEREMSIKELGASIQELFPDRKLIFKSEPLPKDDPKQRRPDLSRAKNNLNGWTPKVSLEEGLRKMKLWLDQNPSILQEWMR